MFNDYFGSSIAICESYSIVCTSYEDDEGGGGSGKAYIFSNSTGNLLHTLDNPNAYGTSASDQFGISVAICESYSIVGAYSEDEPDNLTSGKAYIFSNSTGKLLKTIDNPNAYGTADTDRFGAHVGIYETSCIVSAILEDDAEGISSGKAYIYSITA